MLWRIYKNISQPLCFREYSVQVSFEVFLMRPYITRLNPSNPSLKMSRERSDPVVSKSKEMSFHMESHNTLVKYSPPQVPFCSQGVATNQTCVSKGQPSTTEEGRGAPSYNPMFSSVLKPHEVSHFEAHWLNTHTLNQKLYRSTGSFLRIICQSQKFVTQIWTTRSKLWR